MRQSPTEEKKLIFGYFFHEADWITISYLLVVQTFLLLFLNANAKVMTLCSRYFIASIVFKLCYTVNEIKISKKN